MSGGGGGGGGGKPEPGYVNRKTNISRFWPLTRYTPYSHQYTVYSSQVHTRARVSLYEHQIILPPAEQEIIWTNDLRLCSFVQLLASDVRYTLWLSNCGSGEHAVVVPTCLVCFISSLACLRKTEKGNAVVKNNIHRDILIISLCWHGSGSVVLILLPYPWGLLSPWRARGLV